MFGVFMLENKMIIVSKLKYNCGCNITLTTILIGLVAVYKKNNLKVNQNRVIMMTSTKTEVVGRPTVYLITFKKYEWDTKL